LKFEHKDLVCPVCGSKDIVFDPDTSEYVCTRCGTVIDDHVIDHGYEFRFYDNKKILPRTSGNYTNRIHDQGIGGTKIGYYGRNEKYRRMSRNQRKLRVNKKEKIVEKALKHLNDYIRLLKPPSYVNETAAWILREAVRGKNYKEKTLRDLAAASIYLAYKINGIPRSIKIFSKDANIPSGRLWHAVRKIHENVSNINRRIRNDDPVFFVPYLTQKLNLSQKVRYLANYIASLARDHGLTNGKSALGVATAAVYIASILLDEKRTQLEIAKTIDVTDVTIRNRYDDIVRNFDIEVRL